MGLGLGPLEILTLSSTYLSLNSLLREEILVHIRQPEGTPLNHFRRIIWCPFIPEESEDCCEESSPTVALLHEDRVREPGVVKEGQNCHIVSVH